MVIPKKVLNYETVYALARLGVSQGNIARACNFTEHSFSTRKMNDPHLQEMLSKGKSDLEIDIKQSLVNKSFGPEHWEPNKEVRTRKIGLKGDTRTLLYIAEKMEPSTTKVQISGDSSAPIQVTSLAALMAGGGGQNEEKPQEKVNEKKAKIAPLTV